MYLRIRRVGGLDDILTARFNLGRNELRHEVPKHFLTPVVVMLTAVLAITICDTYPLVARAQAQPSANAQPLLDLLAGTVRTALSGDQGVTSAASQARRILSLPNGQPIPNMLTNDDRFKKSLAAFNVVPKTDGSLGDQGGANISTLLGQIAANVEFGQPDLTPSDEDQISKANSILYTNTTLGLKTEEYKKYLEYKSQYDDVTQALKSLSDPSQRAPLLAKARQIEREWGLFGNKGKIDTALGVVSSLAANDGPRLLRSWQSSISSGSDLRPESFFGLFSASEWLRVSLSSTDLKQLQLAARGPSEVNDLPSLQSISFDYTVFRIVRPALQHPFLQDHSWRTTNGFIISGGNPAMPSASELIPQVVSALIVVKNVELTFTDPLSTEVDDLLHSSKPVSISGIVMRADGTAGLSYQARYVATGVPNLIGYLSESLPKIPDPTPGRSWSK